MGYTVPRGIRNNNPGNIRVGMPWQGLMPDEKKKDPHRQEMTFCVFDTPEWGIRAIVKILQTYGRTRRAADGSRIDTIREIIARWAPSTENDTDKYVRDVCDWMGQDPDVPIDIEDYCTIWALVEAIIRKENGQMPYKDDTIAGAMLIAGVKLKI